MPSLDEYDLSMTTVEETTNKIEIPERDDAFDSLAEALVKVKEEQIKVMQKQELKSSPSEPPID